ncbi:SNase-domain-containing protein [Aureobasidium subglaciale]|nr:SNase-domain-containing protein [Aureobasidium subglaciale]KAI5232518.1 SNase-domain-containing protein [Aureobasidium subglaciale]KAI5234843.1 SNase-domain-containing protein [Aureobasidium subglaciale]KAI5268309.1 SNase-domain-containing protein [Aureobasidium subglaciale]
MEKDKARRAHLACSDSQTQKVVPNMQWPDWLKWRSSDEKEKEPVAWSDSLNATDWSHYSSPRTILPTAILTVSTLALIRIYRRHLRRVPEAQYITPSYFHKRNLYGYVSRVGDGDNFRLFHTPGGRMTGWGWLPSRKIQDWAAKEFKDKTIHVRIAGVDAPETAHFGNKEQPFGKEALEWLRTLLHKRYVRAYIFRLDQYQRVVASVSYWKWGFWKTDVGLEMIKNGMATVYEAKFGSEFGNKEDKYRRAMEKAQRKQIGMWRHTKPGLIGKLIGQKSEKVETPREYKTRVSNLEKAEAAQKK